ncbi:hypothetical protein [Sphingobium sp. TKS]|uniref:hypothetical protein n=1 Tax=Sphingobium sp. TKS TaxID=1315974 RepID=UPI0007705CF1|nr:hypothetical protein [Sphingobium sp. TKS]AMK25565.1 recombinase [Sphingobium sp. TKS]
MRVKLILKGGAADKINIRIVAMEAWKRELEKTLAAANEPPALLHPNMGHHYREQLDENVSCTAGGLRSGLQQAAIAGVPGAPAGASESAFPVSEGKTKNPACGRVFLVAGAGNHLNSPNQY